MTEIDRPHAEGRLVGLRTNGVGSGLGEHKGTVDRTNEHDRDPLSVTHCLANLYIAEMLTGVLEYLLCWNGHIQLQNWADFRHGRLAIILNAEEDCAPSRIGHSHKVLYQLHPFSVDGWIEPFLEVN